VTAERLTAERRGAGPPVVLVHGFTQTGRSWAPVAEHLAGRFEVITVDAPGHGGSADVRADLGAGAELIGATGGRATYVGYSMGGRLCLHLAVARPDLVERLVLISATGGIDDDGGRAARRAGDEQLAASIERDGVDAFLDGWVAQPMFAGLPDPGLDDRRRNTAAGLASSLRLAGTGTQEPLWDRLSALTMPVLVVAGALDAKFVAAAERMAELIPDVTLAVVADAGHTVHLERPDAFLTVLDAWLPTTH
jgi:2-succinyl-6-hydroxy-2,4-cyclohexadiene-1-carboxylate synthase